MATSQPNSSRWSEQEIAWLRANYALVGKLESARRLGRTESAVRYKASELGLKLDQTTEFWKEFQSRAAKSKVGKKRPDQSEVMKSLHAQGKLRKTPEQRKRISERVKRLWQTVGHPRGATGMKHTKETLVTLSKKSRAAWQRMTPEQRRKRSEKFANTIITRGVNKTVITNRSWKAGYRTTGERSVFFRSRWEANYARYLETLKVVGSIAEWEHEPEGFTFPTDLFGARVYIPDFKITLPDGSTEYHEVKGWMDSRSKANLFSMKEHYPDVTLVLIDAKKYKRLDRKYRWTIEGWERTVKTT